MVGVSLIVSALSHCCFSHGTVSSTYARQISHRYRPNIIILPNREPFFADRDGFNRYVRARIAVEKRGSFAVVSHAHWNHDDTRFNGHQMMASAMSLFVVHRSEDAHVLKAILWGTDATVMREQSMKSLIEWHDANFFLRFVQDLRDEDFAMWENAKR